MHPPAQRTPSRAAPLANRTSFLSVPWTGCPTWMASSTLSAGYTAADPAERPECTLTVVGRVPPPQILALARSDHPSASREPCPMSVYLGGSRVSIVPLRSGGGTRLKISEFDGRGVPVVSTTGGGGAEGLDVTHPSNIRLADTPAAFAGECLQLLNDKPARARIAAAGLQLVASRYSVGRIARDFEEILAGVAPCAG